MRGTMPKPFQRPSVTVGASPAKRTWQDIPTSEVLVDDVVANHGLVVRTTAREGHLLVKFQSGIEISSEAIEVVKAFHPVA